MSSRFMRMAPTHQTTSILWRLDTSVLLTLASALAQVSLGYETSIASLIPTLTKPQSSDWQESEVPSPDSASFIATEAKTISHTVGVLFGAILTFLLGTYLGRKRSILVGASFAALGCVITISSSSTAQVLAGQVLNGVGGGFTATTAPVWQVEALDVKLRGRMVATSLVARLFGDMVASWIEYGYGQGDSRQTEITSWRLPVSMQLIPLAALLVLLLVLPESPRWLLGRGRRDDALRAIARNRRAPIDSDIVAEEFHRLQVPGRYDYTTPMDYLRRAFGKLGWYKLPPDNARTTQKQVKYRMAIGAILQLLVQLTGGVTFRYYFSGFLTYTVDASLTISDLLGVIATTWYVVCGLISVFSIDRLGRRGTMLMSFAGMCIACTILTALLATLQKQTYGSSPRALGIATYAMYFVLLAFWAIISVAVWVYPAEINAWSSRSAGAAVATFAAYLGNLAATMMTPSLVVRVEGVFGTVFIAINALALILGYLFLPETSGRSLEWLDWYYEHGAKVLVIRDRRATKRRWTRADEVMDEQEVELEHHVSLKGSP